MKIQFHFEDRHDTIRDAVQDLAVGTIIKLWALTTPDRLQQSVAVHRGQLLTIIHSLD